MIKIIPFWAVLFCLLTGSLCSHGATRQPLYVDMPANTKYSPAEGLAWYIQAYRLPAHTSFRLLNTLKDELGYTHYRYIQTYNGIDVLSTMWLVHTYEGYVVSMNGLTVNNLPLPVKPVYNEAGGLTQALSFVNAKLYKWQLPAEEQWVKHITGNPQATLYPKAQEVWVSSDITDDKVPFKLCYGFDIYAQEPMSRQYVYVDVQDGHIVWSVNRICTAHKTSTVKDTAKTVYSGLRIIETDSLSPTDHILDDSSRGAHIKTLNLQQTTTYGSAIDFTNKGSFWNDSNATWDQYATDAHWATEMTYDFYKTSFNRNSVDDSGHALYSYVHYSTSFYNAFWDGNEMTYGDGYGQPLTALDITGHEISHGVTQYTANLNYINESGALNEGFSDCMGKSVEHFARPSRFKWPISDDLSPAFRDMSNPKSVTPPQPTTYKGAYWYTGTSDNGGVHQNNSILTYWFYLLSAGGSGKNDNGDTFMIHRIGIDTAKQILYRAQSVYNVPSTQYKDARVNTIRAAGDLYGLCSKIYKEVTNAWHAVGVGDTFSSKVISIPLAARTSYCSIPASVSFNSNSSVNARAFKWYFGDGDSSTLISPTHLYKRAGNFTVRLIADGGKCGHADSTRVNYIAIALSAPPIINNDTLCAAGKGTLTVNAGASNYYVWYDSAYGGNVVDTGVTFNTPVVTNTTTYYVEQAERDLYLSPKDTTFGSGTIYTAGSTHGLIFNAIKAFTLKSVLVYSDVNASREIDLLDSAGNVLNAVVVTIPAGGSRVTLNLYVPKGNNYELALNGGSTTNLYRSRSGASYPYNLIGVVSITGNDISSSYPYYYYFFYNWDVQAGDCRSARGSAKVVIPSGSHTASISAGGSSTFCTGDSVVLTSSTGSAYKWSTGDTSKSITVKTSGLYDVAVTVGNCNVYSAYDTVNVLPYPTVSITPGSNVGICAGKTRLLTALSTAKHYKWSTGDTTISIKVNTPGTYAVYSNNGYCRSSIDSVNVVAVTSPVVSATVKPDNTINTFTFINTSTHATGYYWSLANGSGFSTSPDSFTYTYTGGYPKPGNSVTDTVIFIANNSACTDTVKIPIYHIWYGSQTIDINNSLRLQLYPNPADKSAQILINTASDVQTTVDLYDATGRLVKNIFNGMVTNNTKALYLSVQPLSSGLYFIKLSACGQTQYLKLVINH